MRRNPHELRLSRSSKCITTIQIPNALCTKYNCMSNYLKGTVTSKATNDNTDTVEGSAYNLHPTKKKTQKKTKILHGSFVAIPLKTQLPTNRRRVCKGPHGFCWSRCWSRWLPSFPSKLGATGSPQNREPWEERLASAERVEQREPKMLDWRKTSTVLELDSRPH